MDDSEVNQLRTQIAELEAQLELTNEALRSLEEEFHASELHIDELNDEIEALMAEMDDHC